LKSNGPRNSSAAVILAASCALTIPLQATAQSVANTDGVPAPAAVYSTSTVAGSDLPDAPGPTAPQNTAPQSEPQAQPQSEPQAQPQHPASGQGQTQPNAPSLGDLGFSPQQTEANAKLQARLNKRTHMLKVHQTLGLITVAPLLATVIVSGGAKQKHSSVPGTPPVEPSSSGVDLHAALGSTTAAMYGLTAYYAIAAPKIPGIQPKGAIRLHRDLVWVHLPGMVLTPILGGMALNQENQGEKVHGIASAHAYVAWTTVAAYGASIVAVSWPIHIKFWEHP
jgi:hypothetical protein